VVDNRRARQRVQECLPAWYRFDRCAFLRSSLLDVSEGGARLVASDTVPDGEVHLTIRLAGQHISLIARRAWQRPLRRGYLVGLRFEEAGSADAGHLTRWVRRQVQLGELHNRVA
jgi:hypothetical protein